MKKITLQKQFLFTIAFLTSIGLFAQLINSENFDTGDFTDTIWNDGGTNCSIVSNSALNGGFKIELTDGADDPKHTAFTDALDLSSYVGLSVTFDFETDDFTGGDDFYLEYSSNGGSSWTKIGDYNVDVEFTDGVSYYDENVSISNLSHPDAFGSSIILRFRASATSGPNEGDLLFIDNIRLEGITEAVFSTLSNTGEEDLGDDSVDTGSSDLELYYDGNEQIIAVRFDNLNIHKDAVVSAAYIQFTGEEDAVVGSNSTPITMRISGDFVADSKILEEINSDLSNRTTTDDDDGTYVDWTFQDWSDGGEGANEQTVDLKNIVTKITSLPSWSKGNAMTFLFKGVSGSSNTIKKRAESGQTASSAPKLYLVYEPVADIEVSNNNVSIADGDVTPDLADGTDFGSYGLSATKNVIFSIENTGGNVLNLTGSPYVEISGTGASAFSVTQPSGNAINGGASLDFTVSFTPLSVQQYDAKISIANNVTDPAKYEFDIQGTGAILNYDFDLVDKSSNAVDISSGNSPSLLNDTDFGATNEYDWITKSYYIVNTGNSELTISSITSANATNFIVSNIPSSVEVGETASFDIQFRPNSINTFSSAITIQSNDTDQNPFVFTVGGTGVNPGTNIDFGDGWSYLDDGSNQGTAWQDAVYDDSSWAKGFGEFGYGDGDEATVVGYGPDSNDKYVTTYFRREIYIDDVSEFLSIDLEAIRDDGMIVYFNGEEVWRDNVVTNPSYIQLATGTIGDGEEQININVPKTHLADGINIIAVEIHQATLGSSDVSFNLELVPSKISASATQIIRGPYLQSLTETSVIVRWRTETNETGTTINFGEDVNNLNQSVSDDPVAYGDQRGDRGYDGFDHEVTITGLTRDTKYFYNIEDDEGLYLQEGNEIYVKTAPETGSTPFVRAWILGDAGTANNNQRNVRDAYYNYVDDHESAPVSATSHIGQTDMMLFLGDNAYNDGHDDQFQDAFYDIYDDMFKKSVAWSTLGNHESSYNGLTIDPYYNMFTFPTNGEAGGEPSGTEAYYSFDYANIHFIVLESLNVDDDATFRTNQKDWLTTDLADTNQDWIVAFFHHPPYTNGSHDSDNDGETGLKTMREEFLPILENGGVDLTLSGHSHSYERSYFINGHTGKSGTFDAATHVVGSNAGVLTSGKEDLNERYERDNASSDDGAVYITAGSSGKTSGVTKRDPFYSALNELGSTIMEVEDVNIGDAGQRMNIKFLNDSGQITDYFTIFKPAAFIRVLANDKVENLLEDGITIYPVPARSLLNIQFANNENLESVKFYNTVGAMVKESKKSQINVSDLNSGVYLLNIVTNSNTYYKSIIIE